MLGLSSAVDLHITGLKPAIKWTAQKIWSYTLAFQDGFTFGSNNWQAAPAQIHSLNDTDQVNTLYGK